MTIKPLEFKGIKLDTDSLQLRAHSDHLADRVHVMERAIETDACHPEQRPSVLLTIEALNKQIAAIEARIIIL